MRICDRCGKKGSDVDRRGYLELEEDIDLCEDCNKEFYEMRKRFSEIEKLERANRWKTLTEDFKKCDSEKFST
jgi:hypothetical protein